MAQNWFEAMMQVLPSVLTTIVVTPNPASVATESTVKFTAEGLDQNGTTFPISPTWSVSGGGTIDPDPDEPNTAVYTAGDIPGTFTVTATDGAVSGQAQVTVTNQLVISNLTVASGKPYVVDTSGLSSGDRVYIDRKFTYNSVPSVVQGAAYIQTANSDQNSSDTDTSFLSFSVNQAVTVYVAYDQQQATSLPNWLSSNWTNTGEILDTTDATLLLYSRDFPAGTVSLGGNKAAGARGAQSNYTVVIAGL
jgi:hypothetical protein